MVFQEVSAHRQHGIVQQPPLAVQEALGGVAAALDDDGVALHARGDVVPGGGHEGEFALQVCLEGCLSAEGKRRWLARWDSVGAVGDPAIMMMVFGADGVAGAWYGA